MYNQISDKSPFSKEFIRSLRHPNENIAYTWLFFFSLISWGIFAFILFSTFGIVLIIIGGLFLVKNLVERFFAAFVKVNAIKASKTQFPEIYKIVLNFSNRLGKNPPTVYVLQESTWNAFAAKLAGKRIVVLLSGAIDSLLLKGSIDQLAWVIGHELGHHFAGHLNMWRQLTEALGSWFFWVRLWCSRQCEFTCDRYGLACTNSLKSSLSAAANMTVGAQMAEKVNIEAAIEQWEQHRKEFFVIWRTIYLTHPHNLQRMDALIKSAKELNIS